MTDVAHRAFFGDGERDFCLTPEMITELERKLDTGVGGLCQRLFAGHFKQVEITETIRLALVGGGTKPDEADALVAAYAVKRPLAETYPLAVAILERLWFGTTKEAA